MRIKCFLGLITAKFKWSQYLALQFLTALNKRRMKFIHSNYVGYSVLQLSPRAAKSANCSSGPFPEKRKRRHCTLISCLHRWCLRHLSTGRSNPHLRTGSAFSDLGGSSSQKVDLRVWRRQRSWLHRDLSRAFHPQMLEFSSLSAGNKKSIKADVLFESH